MEKRNPADDRGTGDEMIAIFEQRFEKGNVFRIAFHELVVRVLVDLALDSAVFPKVVEPNDLVTL